MKIWKIYRFSILGKFVFFLFSIISFKHETHLVTCKQFQRLQSLSTATQIFFPVVLLYIVDFPSRSENEKRTYIMFSKKLYIGWKNINVSVWYVPDTDFPFFFVFQ